MVYIRLPSSYFFLFFMNSNSPLRQACLKALKTFIDDACNENKMELHLVFEDIDDADKEKILGTELYQVLSRIIYNNDHPDDFLQDLNNRLVK